MDITQTVSQLGPESALVVALIYGGYRVITWLGPRLDAHLTETANTQAELKECTIRMADKLDNVQGDVRSVKESMAGVCRAKV